MQQYASVASIISNCIKSYAGRIEEVSTDRVGAISVMPPFGKLFAQTLDALFQSAIERGATNVYILCNWLQGDPTVTITLGIVDNGAPLDHTVFQDRAMALGRLAVEAATHMGRFQTEQNSKGIRTVLVIPLKPKRGVRRFWLWRLLAGLWPTRRPN